MFEKLSPEQQQQQYYVEHGFLLLPGVVSPEQIEAIAAEMSGSPRYDLLERWPGPVIELRPTASGGRPDVRRNPAQS